MKFIRIVGAASAVAVLFLGSVGAGAALAAAPNVVINSPGADASYESYPTISGSITQEGAQPELTSAKVALSSQDGWTSENSEQAWPGSSVFSGGGANLTFSWVPKPKYNGKYTVTMQASGRSGGFGGSNVQTNIVTRSFSIEIAPTKPTGIAAGGDSGEVTVTWKANPEPDISSYQVYRSYQNGSAGAVGNPVPASSKPTFKDDLSGKPQGSYKYQVQAIRRARTCASANDEACSRGIAGPRSDFSAAVTVKAPGATTTTSTTRKPNTGGGSTGGGSTGGGSTGGGSTGGGSTGGGSKPGSGTNTGKTAPRNTGGFAPGGNVDLSQFGGLLGGNGRTTRNGEVIDEGTYDGELPYDPSEQPVNSGTGDDDSLISLGGADIPTPDEDWVKFIGAGSLMTALLVHVLWFKQQVDALPLETID